MAWPCSSVGGAEGMIRLIPVGPNGWCSHTHFTYTMMVSGNEVE